MPPHEKCLERIQLHLPETLHRDTLVEAAEQDLSANAFVRKVLEQYLYGSKGKRDARRREMEHNEARR